MNNLTLFDSEFQEDRFESNCKENGFTYWLARDLMHMLGYESWTSFKKAIDKAMVTMTTLDIDLSDNICQITNIVDGKNEIDFKLSRLSCYLVAMNADNKKLSVAKAQAYFANLAGAVQNYLTEAESVERINTRSEVSEREKSLSGIAHASGIESYPLFQNAGYRGMYNKNMKSLRTMRGIPEKKSLLDFMGKEELAANLFRITQTELKIKNDNIYGQKPLERTAESVGKEVRETMKRISGIAPEDLPAHEDIKQVKKEIKEKGKALKKIDSNKKKK